MLLVLQCILTAVTGGGVGGKVEGIVRLSEDRLRKRLENFDRKHGEATDKSPRAAADRLGSSMKEDQEFNLDDELLPGGQLKEQTSLDEDIFFGVQR